MSGQAAETVRARRGREANARSRISAAGYTQTGWRSVRSPMDAARIVSDDAAERIHAASLTILEEIGIDFLSDEARAIAVSAGATPGPEPMRLRFDRALGAI